VRKRRIFEHITLDGSKAPAMKTNFPYSDWSAPYRTPAGRDLVTAMLSGTMSKPA
jgi:hypothetical protein